MRNIKILLILSMIVSFVILFPTNVYARSYESDFLEVGATNNRVFETNEFELSIHYDSGVGADAIGVFGVCKGKDPTFNYYHYIFTFFDINKKELFEINGHGWTEDISKTPEGIKMSDYFLHIDYTDSKYFPYGKESPVKYYKLYIEPSTYENASTYIVAKNNKAKLEQDYSKTDKDTMLLTVKSNVSPTNNNIIFNSNEYEIAKYKIEIDVNENNTFNIKEEIIANFLVNKHGIFRKIPLKNEIIRLDGTTSINRARINNIEVNEQYTTYNENNYKVIKIGNPNKTLTGSNDYFINYLYNIGKDPVKEYDELYFNIVGNEWDTTIDDLEFIVTMPKEFDKTKIGFSSGYDGSTDNSKIEYSVEGNVISGKYNGILNAGEALTIRLELPEGYFVGAGYNYSYLVYLLYILPVVFALISFILWFKYGKDDTVIETVEFYPPEGFNSAEVGFIYKGRVDNKDIVSLLIYLANKGYLKIEESEINLMFSTKKDFKITKIKDYDGTNENEKIFFNGLFDSYKKNKYMNILDNYIGDEQQITNQTPKLIEVTSTDLYNSFYITLNLITKNINSKQNIEGIFEKSSLIKSMVLLFMIIISILTILSVPILEYGTTYEIGLTLIIALFYTPFYAVTFSKKVPLSFRLPWGIFTILHSLVAFFSLPIREAIFSDSILLYGFLIGLFCSITMLVCYKLMPRRNPRGNELLGRIKGFKTFLETAEKEKLEELVMQNPSYFYNILPFTYVLGVSDKWIKKFEAIGIQEPDWYSGGSSFSVSSFGSFMSSTMTSASTAMTSSPSSGGGSSGGSGGGSSGGGSGGGGGGSW